MISHAISFQDGSLSPAMAAILLRPAPHGMTVHASVMAASSVCFEQTRPRKRQTFLAKETSCGASCTSTKLLSQLIWSLTERMPCVEYGQNANVHQQIQALVRQACNLELQCFPLEGRDLVFHRRDAMRVGYCLIHTRTGWRSSRLAGTQRSVKSSVAHHPAREVPSPGSRHVETHAGIRWHHGQAEKCAR